MKPEPMTPRVMRKVLAGHLQVNCWRCGRWTDRTKALDLSTGECGRCENAIKREQAKAAQEAHS